MKKNKLTIIMICVLVVLTAILTVVHLTTRQQETENAIQVVFDGKTVTVPLDKLTLVQVQGTMVTGKGEQRPIDSMGISVADLLKQAKVPAKGVTVTSGDEYSVSLTAEEVAADNKAWLLIEEGSARLIVFGDENSKRNVKNVVRLTVE
jgi:hypothetical protein